MRKDLLYWYKWRDYNLSCVFLNITKILIIFSFYITIIYLTYIQNQYDMLQLKQRRKKIWHPVQCARNQNFKNENLWFISFHLMVLLKTMYYLYCDKKVFIVPSHIIFQHTMNHKALNIILKYYMYLNKH